MLPRRLLFLIVCAATSACTDCSGRLAEDDAGADAPTSMCTGGAFTKITALAELNTPANERGLRFTPDELHGVFSREDETDAQVKPFDIFATTRTSRSDPLGAPQVAVTSPEMTTFVQLYPSIASDGWLRFESWCAEPIHAGSSPLCVSVPPSDAGGLTAFIADNDFVGCGGPFGGAGVAGGDGFVTRDAGAYYFVNLTSPDGGLSRGACDPDGSTIGQAIFVQHSTYDQVPTYFNTDPARITADGPYDNPVLTDDELTMYVSTTSAGIPHVYVATRATTLDGFTNIAPVPELDSAEGEYPSWISPDRCRLYLTRKVGGQWDLYVASRIP